MTSNHKGDMVQYVPFSSFVHPSFWHALTDIKLNVDKLNESSRQIVGRFTYREDIGTAFEIDGTSFNKVPEKERFYQNVAGVIINKNTVEDFKNIDKVTLLNTIGKETWEGIKNNWITDPTSLLSFFILSFADLKKFNYYYWFAFPTPNKPVSYFTDRSKQIKNDFNDQQIIEIHNGFKILVKEQQSFFVVDIKEHISVKPLGDVIIDHKKPDLSTLYFAFTDPSKESNPGWPLRLFIAALLEHYPSLHDDIIRVIGVRCDKIGDIRHSRIFYLRVPEVTESSDSTGWVGWERNDKGNFGPKLANMSASMCPIKLADTSSDLNIKLMKWRLVPDLNVDVMKKTKCLLLGAGTLGCHVARDLLAWGFRHITFLDNGKVSFSNPTRQVLYNFQDCLSNKKKAEAASDNLKLILPTVNTKGLSVHIPMPGHPVGEALIDETTTNINILTDEIVNHDVIFLLLDTREARWLPTLIAAHYGKIVINAALGFDSYLVIRHGVTSSAEYDEQISIKKPYIPGGQLGCYFCNDVTAPGNSTRDRTLDQQCTVTRPGVAAVAGALAVEVLVALLQHPLRIEAPAVYNLSSESDISPDMAGVLGPIPHSIRGFLHSYQTVLPTCAKFKQCIACSDAVLRKYKEEGSKFLFKVFNSGTYLEEVTGLTAMHLAAEMTDVLTFSDEESDNSQ